MDIISLGDFAISNHKGKTTFSFRIPSGEEIYFVDQHNKKIRPQPQAISKKVARNSKCPCRSGKKYKQCCGKLT